MSGQVFSHISNQPLYMVIPLMIISLSLLTTSPAWAENLHIAITTPSPNAIFYNSTVVMTGTFVDSNTTSVYTISGLADGNSVASSITGSNTWSVEFTNLSPGWHRIGVEIADQLYNAEDYEEVMVITGHMSQPKQNVLLIKESETCLTLLKINATSDCPTLGQLLPWDTSNQNIMGKIIQEPNGQWIRTKAEVSQWWNFINKTGNPVVCVECDFDYSLIDQAQMIILEPKSFSFPSTSSYTYYNTTESYWNGTMYLTRAIQVPQQYKTLVINHDRYIYPDCSTADLVFSPQMMSDTIASMDNNCQKTNLILNSTINIPIQPFDFAHSNWYHGQKWLENVTQTSTQNCITHVCSNVASDPYHTHSKLFAW